MPKPLPFAIAKAQNDCSLVNSLAFAVEGVKAVSTVLVVGAIAGSCVVVPHAARPGAPVAPARAAEPVQLPATGTVA